MTQAETRKAESRNGTSRSGRHHSSFLLSAFCLPILLLHSAFAANVTFTLSDWTGGAGTNGITLTPASQPAAAGGRWVLGPAVSVSPVNGSATASNLAAGLYRVAFAGLSRAFTLLVPDTNGAVNSLSILASPTNSPADMTVAWSAGACDARYPTFGWVTNYVGANAAAGGSSGMFYATGGLAVGESPWQPTVGSAPAYGIGTLSLSPDPVNYADSVLAIQRHIMLADGVAFSSVNAVNSDNMSLEFRASDIVLAPLNAVGVGKQPTLALLDVADAINTDSGFMSAGVYVIDSSANATFNVCAAMSGQFGGGTFSAGVSAMQLTVTNAVTLKPSNSPTVTGKDAALWWSNGVALYIKTTNSTKLIITVP